MWKAKYATGASAIVLVCAGSPVFGQYVAPANTSAAAQIDIKARDNPDERPSAVIRIIDGDNPAAPAAPVSMAELARARAAGDMQAPERGEPIQVERIQLDDRVRSGNDAGAHAATGVSAVAESRGTANGRPQIVYADKESADRAKTRPVVRLDDAARYRETVKYEADRKRRESEKVAAAREQARRQASEPVAVVGNMGGRADISWSAPERLESRVAALEVPTELLFE